MARITEQFPHGQHIDLFCINHPEKRWSTKNIDGIGCRTIFYNLSCDMGMGSECDCPASALRPVVYPELPEEVSE